jgi:hypothetical protein
VLRELQYLKAQQVGGGPGETGSGAAAQVVAVIVDLAEQALGTLSFVLGDEGWKRDALCLEYPSVVFSRARGVGEAGAACLWAVPGS